MRMEKEGIVVETLKPVGTSTNKLWGESQLKRKKMRTGRVVAFMWSILMVACQIWFPISLALHTTQKMAMPTE